MTWSIRDLFPPWGDSGESPPDNTQYSGGDTLRQAHLDYLWKSMGDLENQGRFALEDIDGDADGIVDESDSVTPGGRLLGDLTDDAATPITIWDDFNKEVPDSALGQVGTSALAADDGTGNIATTALAADANNDGKIDTTALAADGNNNGLIDTVNLYVDRDGDGLIEDYDEGLLKEGGSRALDDADLSGGLGTANQVLETDGSTTSWGDFAGTTDYSWTLGQVVHPSASSGLALASFGTWDQILVSFDLSITSGQADWKIRVNADTGTNYDYVIDSGQRITSGTGWTVAQAEFGASDIAGTMHISGRWTNECVASVEMAVPAGERTQYGNNGFVTSPLDRVALINDSGSSTMTGTIAVYGRNTQ